MTSTIISLRPRYSANFRLDPFIHRYPVIVALIRWPTQILQI